MFAELQPCLCSHRPCFTNLEARALSHAAFRHGKEAEGFPFAVPGSCGKSKLLKALLISNVLCYQERLIADTVPHS